MPECAFLDPTVREVSFLPRDEHGVKLQQESRDEKFSPFLDPRLRGDDNKWIPAGGLPRGMPSDEHGVHPVFITGVRHWAGMTGIGRIGISEFKF